MPASAHFPLRVIDNAVVWPGDGRAFRGHVAIVGDRIAAVAPGPWPGGEPATVFDARGRAVSPGLVDLMVLGGFDRSILRDDPLDIAREYLTLGVTACQFCTGTLPWDAQVQVGRNVSRARAADDAAAARVVGLYLEGPFQHPDFTGASLRENSLPPTPDNVARVLDALGDTTTMINVSPGMPDSPTAVRQFAAAGKTVSMAHSAAPAADVIACVEAGTTVLGHVFDNNSGLIGDSYGSHLILARYPSRGTNGADSCPTE
jgi:N-acetylglucosamine-6-phosphate deacetylase